MFGPGFDSRHLHQMYDPLRKKDVAATAEEQVRQWFIGVLHDSVGVPLHLMMSEVGFKFGDKRYRADILVYDRAGGHLAIVECKRPEVALTPAVLEQAMRYNAVLGVRYLFVTNGTHTFAYRLIDGVFSPLAALPAYNQM